MITITTAPNELEITSYPIAYFVNATQYIEQSGTQPWIIFQKIGALLDGYGFIFPFITSTAYNGFEFDYMIAIAIVEAPIYLKENGTLDEHIENFNQNYFVNKNYTIEKIDTDKIKFTYNDYRQYLNMVEIIEDSNGAYTFDSQDLGTEQMVKPLKVLAILFYEQDYNSDIYERQELFFDVDNDGNSIIKFQEILKSLFTDNDLPTFAQNTVSFCEHIVKHYKFHFGEYFTDTNNLGRFIITDPKLMFNTNLFVLENNIEDFSSYITTNKKYLTNMPAKINTGFGTHQFLYYFHLTTDTAAKIKYLVYYEDLTTEIAFISIPVITKYDTLLIPAYYDFIITQIINPDSKTIYKYSVEVYTTTDVLLANEQMFVLVQEFPFQKDFLFENEFSVFETLMCTGTIENEKQLDNEIYKIILEPNFDIAKGIFITNKGKSYNQYTAYTGYKPKNEIENIERLLKSNNFYLIDYTNSNYIPCRLLSSSVEISDTQTNIFSLKFNYRIAYDN